MNLEFALRDEKVNIFSMIFRKQLILCKSDKFSEKRLGPYLLDCKRANANYKLSEFGKIYENRVKDTFLPLKYAAFIDSQIKFKVTDAIFETLCSRKFFNVWDKSAPLKFFTTKGNEEGYLIIFRVFEIDNEIPESLLSKGRSGRNFYYKLTEIQDIKLIKPVISDFEFSLEKNELIDTIKKNNALIEISDSELNLSLEEDLHFNISEPEFDYEVLHVKPLSLDYLKKIPKQRDSKSTSWNRNPQLAKSMLVNYLPLIEEEAS